MLYEINKLTDRKNDLKEHKEALEKTRKELAVEKKLLAAEEARLLKEFLYEQIPSFLEDMMNLETRYLYVSCVGMYTHPLLHFISRKGVVLNETHRKRKMEYMIALRNLKKEFVLSLTGAPVEDSIKALVSQGSTFKNLEDVFPLLEQFDDPLNC